MKRNEMNIQLKSWKQCIISNEWKFFVCLDLNTNQNRKDDFFITNFNDIIYK